MQVIYRFCLFKYEKWCRPSNDGRRHCQNSSTTRQGLPSLRWCSFCCRTSSRQGSWMAQEMLQVQGLHQNSRLDNRLWRPRQGRLLQNLLRQKMGSSWLWICLRIWIPPDRWFDVSSLRILNQCIAERIHSHFSYTLVYSCAAFITFYFHCRIIFSFYATPVFFYIRLFQEWFFGFPDPLDKRLKIVPLVFNIPIAVCHVLGDRFFPLRIVKFWIPLFCIICSIFPLVMSLSFNLGARFANEKLKDMFKDTRLLRSHSGSIWPSVYLQESNYNVSTKSWRSEHNWNKISKICPHIPIFALDFVRVLIFVFICTMGSVRKRSRHQGRSTIPTLRRSRPHRARVAHVAVAWYSLRSNSSLRAPCGTRNASTVPSVIDHWTRCWLATAPTRKYTVAPVTESFSGQKALVLVIPRPWSQRTETKHPRSEFFCFYPVTKLSPKITEKKTKQKMDKFFFLMILIAEKILNSETALSR